MDRGLVKGDTLLRIWKTFRLRGHDRRLTGFVPPLLTQQLDSGLVLANEWYPIGHYLALYGALLHVLGRDEVVATAADSVTRALKTGTWKVFVPVLAEFAPELFCQRGLKRFELVWKITFSPGEASVQPMGTGAIEAVVRDVPWSSEESWRAGVNGGLIAIPQYAGLDASCTVDERPGGQVVFGVRWHSRGKKRS